MNPLEQYVLDQLVYYRSKIRELCLKSIKKDEDELSEEDQKELNKLISEMNTILESFNR
jgi:DNA gyrase/topoisomerase IV subunit A